MRNETVAASENNCIARDLGTPLLAGSAASDLAGIGDGCSTAPDNPAAWAADFPNDFTDEEKFFMLDIAAYFPSEREFVALLGGDAVVTSALEPDDDAEQHARLEQHITASVFERLNLPAPAAEQRKK